MPPMEKVISPAFMRLPNAVAPHAGGQFPDLQVGQGKHCLFIHPYPLLGEAG